MRVKVFAGNALEGRNPTGVTGVSADSTSAGRKGLSEGSKPRNRGPSVRLGVFVGSNGGRKR